MLALFNVLGSPGTLSWRLASPVSAKPEPKILNSEPWAMPELGKPAGISLELFNTFVIDGPPPDPPVAPKVVN
jgi:hypothetical protein